MTDPDEPEFSRWFRWAPLAIVPLYFIVPRAHHTLLSVVLMIAIVGAAVYRTQWRKRRGLPPNDSAE